MKHLFEPDTPIMRLLADFADLVVLNLLWILSSIPVLTIGASTAALYRCLLNMVRGEKHWNTRAFFTAFRENFPKATVIWLILLAVLLLLGADFYLFYREVLSLPRLLSWVPGSGIVIWVLLKTYAFPLTAQFENTIGMTILNGLKLSFSYPLRTLLMGFMETLPVLLLLLSPATFASSAIVWVLFGFSLCCYVNTRILVKIFSPLMAPE